jgi:hypothetical protein
MWTYRWTDRQDKANRYIFASSGHEHAYKGSFKASLLLFYTKIYSLIEAVFLLLAMSRVQSNWSLKHLLLQRSRMSGALPPCLLHSSMVWYLGIMVTLRFLYIVLPIPESYVECVRYLLAGSQIATHLCPWVSETSACSSAMADCC